MKIRHRLSLLFSLILLSILLLVSVSIYALYEEFRREDFYDRLTHKAKTTARLLIQVKEIDKDLLRIIDKNTINALYNEKVLIFNENNELIYSSVDDEKITVTEDLLNRIRKEKQIEYQENKNEVIGLFFKRKKSEIVVLASAYDKFGKRKLENLKYILIFVCSISTILSGIIGVFFSSKVLEPIVDINNKVRNITEHNLNERLIVGKNNDEINQLSQNFNQMLERISQAYQNQKNFTGSASHELRTPLAIISSQLEFATRHSRTTEEYNMLLKSVHEDVKNLIALVNALLLLSKADTPETGIIKEPIRIDELLFAAQMELQEYHSNYKISISFDEIPEQEESLICWGNKYLIKTLFKNLIENACKFSPDHKMDVAIGKEGNYHKIRFTDTGIGIPQEELEQIFSPFFRASNAKSNKGFGLGLSICKRIIDQHKGKFKVTSELNEGSEFLIWLPFKI